MKKGITLIEMPFYLVAVFILATIGAMFIGCSDTGVSADDYTNKRCDYTIRYYHPNVDEVISVWATVPEEIVDKCSSMTGYCYKDLYNRTISNDTVVYKNELWTEEELNEHLGNNLPETDADKQNVIVEDNIDLSLRNTLLIELNKRQGELLNVNCYEAKYVTGANNE